MQPAPPPGDPSVQGLIEFVPGAVTVCKVQALMAATRANGDQARWAGRGQVFWCIGIFILDMMDPDILKV